MRFGHQHVHSIAESLDIEDLLVCTGAFGQHTFGFRQFRRSEFQSLSLNAAAKLRRRSNALDLAVVHQRQPMASLGFIEIWSSDENCQAVTGQMCQGIPKFAARNRIDSGRRLIEQEHPRLGRQDAGERELLLHASTEPARQPTGKALHAKHFQISTRPFRDFFRGNAPKVANIADVFGNREVRIETEGLREIARVCARLASRLAEYFGAASCGFDHSSDDLESRSLAGSVGTQKSEYRCFGDFKTDAANGFDRAIVLA